MRKVSTSKTTEALMLELEEMFSNKHIDKTLIRFSGLDGTNAMSGTQNGLQRRIQHVSPYAFYMNCRNHRLALCLVHLLKEYTDREAVDALLLSIRKTFKYSMKLSNKAASCNDVTCLMSNLFLKMGSYWKV